MRRHSREKTRASGFTLGWSLTGIAIVAFLISTILRLVYVSHDFTFGVFVGQARYFHQAVLSAPLRKSFCKRHPRGLSVCFASELPSFRDLWIPVLRPEGMTVPIVYVPVLLAAGSLLLQRHRRRRQPQTGCCSVCGYDLFGNESGRCPECGKPIDTTRVMTMPIA